VSVNLLFRSHFNAFSLFEQASLRTKYLIVEISSKMIVSLSFARENVNDFITCHKMINPVILLSGRTADSFVDICFCIFGLITKSLYGQPVRAETELFISVYILFCGWNYRRFYQGKSRQV